MTPLELLDDLHEDTRDLARSEMRWQELAERIRQNHLKPPATPTKTAPTAPPVQKNVKNVLTGRPAKAASTNPAGRVFRHQPSLRQMMAEYNGRPNTLAPLKASQKPNSSSVSARFSSERIEYYELPGISGRVLRPAR